MTRAKRFAITPSRPAMPVSRKTGAIASWIACEMIGRPWSAIMSLRDEALAWSLQSRREKFGDAHPERVGNAQRVVISAGHVEPCLRAGPSVVQRLRSRAWNDHIA